MQEYTMDSLRGLPRLGARMWGLCFQFFVAEQVARFGWMVNRAHYSMTRNWISDLGATTTPWHWVMNGSFLLQGVLIAGGAVLVRSMFPARFLYWLILFLLLASGMGVFVVGTFPENVNMQVHGLAALIHLLCGNLAMILLGLAQVRRSRGQITLAAGIIGLAGLVTLGYLNGNPGSSLALNAGLIERFTAYPLPLWLTWTGYLMLRRVELYL
jgi:hypothetical membrane protein